MPDGSINFTINEANGDVPTITYTRDEFIDTLRYLQFAGDAMRALDDVTPASAGVVAFDSAGAVQSRTITAGSGITVSNGSGVSGDPTISITNAVATKTADYTLTASDDLVKGDASGGAITLTLPTAVGNSGKEFFIKKIDSTGNSVTVAGDGSETIDGSATQVITAQWTTLTIISDGANWLIT